MSQAERSNVTEIEDYYRRMLVRVDEFAKEVAGWRQEILGSLYALSSSNDPTFWEKVAKIEKERQI